MIPHRLLSNELSGHDLKQRVTACRKRVRVNRHRIHSQESLVSEPTSEMGASFPAEYPNVRESLSEDNEAFEFQRRKLWSRPEQEVGIT